MSAFSRRSGSIKLRDLDRSGATERRGCEP